MTNTYDMHIVCSVRHVAHSRKNVLGHFCFGLTKPFYIARATGVFPYWFFPFCTHMVSCVLALRNSFFFQWLSFCHFIVIISFKFIQ